MKKELSDREKILAIRESTGMNRKQFAEYFDIPYIIVRLGKRQRQGAGIFDYVRMHNFAYSVEDGSKKGKEFKLRT